MQNNKIGFFGIAMTFIGTLIGAGMASGQEILQFFAGFGIPGAVGACLVAVCFSLLGITAMLAARKLNTNVYEQTVSSNRFIRLFMNVIITFFSFGVITVMLAGAGSLSATIFGCKPVIGSAVMAVLTAVVALYGSEGLINSFSVVVPLMVVIAVVAGIFGFLTGPDRVLAATAHLDVTAVGNWLVAALLFVSYNTICAIAVLVPLGYEAKNGRHVVGGAVLGGIVLGAIAIILCVSILRNIQISLSGDMPMYLISVKISAYLGYAYAFVMFAAIFTTAAGLMYALTMRLTQYQNPFTKRKLILVPVLTVLSLLGSSAGFTTLIGTLYPITGYLGFLIIASLVYTFFRSPKKENAAPEIL